ncbi:MAG: hypothetical protein IRY99_00505 [Isosphaeraceae bacterium]|nr:hypothetical protein [Isosphaeraceae bacterium]
MQALRTRSRIADQISAAVERLQLNLSGWRVLTEAATGPYAVTPILAALAGAEVIAFTRESRYGTVRQVRQETSALAQELGISDRVAVVEVLTAADLGSVDLITNSGHLRPIDAAKIDHLKPTAVIPLMYEAWEFRATDVDLAACHRRGIRVAGTNERHPKVGVFAYLGPLVVKAILEANHELLGERCLLISDNDFAPYIRRTLEANGAEVHQVARSVEASGATWDIVIIATTPPLSGGERVSLDGVHADLYCQLWGDVDRTQVTGTWRPEREPEPGHMGLALADLGVAPVVRLQAAGLKCGEVLLRGVAGPYESIVQRDLPAGGPGPMPFSPQRSRGLS